MVKVRASLGPHVVVADGIAVVTKNPADFVGAYIGHSEQNTKKILQSTVGKVLIIDEVSYPLRLTFCYSF